MKRAAILIDGSNIYASARSLGFHIDYKRLLEYFGKEYTITRAFYFTALPDKSIESGLRKMVDYLSYNGYSVVQKEIKQYKDTTTGITKIKGNMDIEVAVYAWKFSELVDEIILFSGDGDFTELVKRIQEVGTSCRVVSTLKGTTPMMSDALRRQADTYTDLFDLRQFIEQRRDNDPITEAITVKRRRFLNGD